MRQPLPRGTNLAALGGVWWSYGSSAARFLRRVARHPRYERQVISIRLVRDTEST